MYLVALIGAANDLIATHLHVSLNAVAWTVRIALCVGPVLTYLVTERWAQGRADVRVGRS